MGRGATARPAAPASLSLDVERARARSEPRDAVGRAAAPAAAARVSRCVIAALFVLALLIVTVTVALPVVVRALRIPRGAGGDRARLFLTFAVRGLPADRVDWARAMLAELDHVDGRRQRWRFSFGCARAAAHIRFQSPAPGGALLRLVVRGCIAIALGLVGYGFVQYPGLRSAPNLWGATIVFVATLFVYTALAVFLSRGETQGSAVARRYGLAGGLAVGAGWLLGMTPPSAIKAWVFLPLLVALIGPAVVAALKRAIDGRSIESAIDRIVLFESVTGGGPARYVSHREASLG